jgi:hypothetical protein
LKVVFFVKAFLRLEPWLKKFIRPGEPVDRLTNNIIVVELLLRRVRTTEAE